MKKLATGCVVFFVLSLFVFPDAVLTFKETRVDFGKIDEDSVAEFSFEFQNTGDSLLIIENVVPSCGCTAVDLQKKEYKPGEKGTIPVKFTGKGYFGRITKAITVHSNDPKNRLFRLMLVGDVIVKNYSFPKVETEQIDFGTIKAGKKYTKELTIANDGTIDLELNELIHYPEIVPVIKDYSIKPNASTVMTMTLLVRTPGVFNKWIRIHTNSIKKRYLMIRLNANVE